MLDLFSHEMGDDATKQTGSQWLAGMASQEEISNCDAVISAAMHIDIYIPAHTQVAFPPRMFTNGWAQYNIGTYLYAVHPGNPARVRCSSTSLAHLWPIFGPFSDDILANTCLAGLGRVFTLAVPDIMIHGTSSQPPRPNGTSRMVHEAERRPSQDPHHGSNPAHQRLQTAGHGPLLPGYG